MRLDRRARRSSNTFNPLPERGSMPRGVGSLAIAGAARLPHFGPYETNHEPEHFPARFPGGDAPLGSRPLVIPAAVPARGQPSRERITIGVFGVPTGGIPLARCPAGSSVRHCRRARDRGESARQMTEQPDAAGQSVHGGCKLYSDFREISPARTSTRSGDDFDHWHGCSTAAIEAGKDIYGENPDAVDRPGRQIEADGPATEHLPGRLQQRSDPKFRLACNLARNGYPQDSISRLGSPVTRFPPSPCDPPEGFDWDMWSGPARCCPSIRAWNALGLYMISHARGSSPTASIIWTSPAGACRKSRKALRNPGRGVLPDNGMADT